jgi:hypothetical protein
MLLCPSGIDAVMSRRIDEARRGTASIAPPIGSATGS